jgi:glycosyl transferase family 25
MQKFVINLKRRPDRLKQFFKRCPLEDVQVIEAFDAKFPTKEDPLEQEIFNNKLKKLGAFNRIGERGVFISHLRIWKKIVQEKIKVALIFEDDAQFNKNFLNVFKEIKKVDNILFLGGRFQDNFITPGIPVSENIVKHDYRSWNARCYDRTAHAYLITEELAKILIELFENTQDPQPVDHFIIIKLKNMDIPVYSTVPLICWSPMVGDSDIR